MLLLAIGSIGVNESVSFHAARRPSAIPSLMATAVWLAVVQGIALVAIGLIVVPLALSNYDDDVVMDGVIFLTMIPIGLAGLYLSWIVNGAHRFGWFNFLRVFVVAVAAVGLIALAIADELTVRTAVYVYLGAQVATLVAATATARALLGRFGRASRALARDVVTFGWKSQLSTLSNLLNERLDQLVISVFLAPADLGIYVVAWTLSSVTSLFGTSVATVALPRIAGLEEIAHSRVAARRYVGLTAVVSLAGAIPLILAAPVIIDVVFGDRFSEATDIARLLIFAGVALGVARALESVLKGANRPLDAGLAEGWGLLVTVIGLAVLLPTIGIIGAAVTSALAYTTSAAFALRRTNAALGTRGLELLIPPRAA
jgi:O-antigen/teichoic acid export membrane protein